LELHVVKYVARHARIRPIGYNVVHLINDPRFELLFVYVNFYRHAADRMREWTIVQDH